MEPSFEDHFYAVRQLDDQFRSPNILRRTIDDEAVVAHTVKKTRRARSTEPTVLQADDPFVRFLPGNEIENNMDEGNSAKRWSMLIKNQENMSKQELVNNYRLLMNEKLRLERFLSIMTKNHEMARNRLESDLLDAMMCIEDLKQVLEIKMARRRKIDPHEAEERRFLIRQNKKLLHQLTESAKKIERLEVTIVEMKEQLELLDFQIVEVENQKAMMEEELRKLPPNVNNETQTEDSSNREQQIISQLRDQLDRMQSDLLNQKAETAGVMAKQSHLDNLVRELRRDNIELRDQLARVDDAENSLAESDKPMAADLISLQTRLQEQTDHICELEEKLKSSKDYVKLLEDRLNSKLSDDNNNANSKNDNNNGADSLSYQISILSRSEIMLAPKQTQPQTGKTDEQAAMYEEMQKPMKLPRVDELLLQETIRTFQTLMDEKDQEISQLKQFVQSHTEPDQLESVQTELGLPPLFESGIQTDLAMQQADQMVSMTQQLNEGGYLLTSAQYTSLADELRRTVTLLCGQTGPDSESDLVCQTPSSAVDFDYILCAANAIRRKAEVLNWKADEEPMGTAGVSIDNEESIDKLDDIQSASSNPLLLETQINQTDASDDHRHQIAKALLHLKGHSTENLNHHNPGIFSQNPNLKSKQINSVHSSSPANLESNVLSQTSSKKFVKIDQRTAQHSPNKSPVRQHIRFDDSHNTYCEYDRSQPLESPTRSARLSTSNHCSISKSRPFNHSFSSLNPDIFDHMTVEDYMKDQYPKLYTRREQLSRYWANQADGFSPDQSTAKSAPSLLHYIDDRSVDAGVEEEEEGDEFSQQTPLGKPHPPSPAQNPITHMCKYLSCMNGYHMEPGSNTHKLSCPTFDMGQFETKNPSRMEKVLFDITIESLIYFSLQISKPDLIVLKNSDSNFDSTQKLLENLIRSLWKRYHKSPEGSRSTLADPANLSDSVVDYLIQFLNETKLFWCLDLQKRSSAEASDLHQWLAGSLGSLLILYNKLPMIWVSCHIQNSTIPTETQTLKVNALIKYFTDMWSTRSTNWLIRNIQQGLMFLQTPPRGWFVAIADLCSVSIETLVEFNNRLSLMMTTWNTSLFKHTTNTFGRDLSRTEILHELLLKRIRLTYICLAPNNILLWSKKMNRLEQSICLLQNQTLGISIGTISKKEFSTPSCLSLSSTSLFDMVICQLDVMLHLKSLLWNIYIEPLLQPESERSLECVTHCLNPSILDHLNELVNTDRTQLWILVMRILCALDFESTVTRPAKPSEFQVCYSHTYSLSNLNSDSLQVQAYTLRDPQEARQWLMYTLNEMLNAYWLLTGVHWSEPSGYSADWSVDHIWINCMKLKQKIMGLLFTPTTVSESLDYLVYNYQQKSANPLRVWTREIKVDDCFSWARKCLAIAVKLLHSSKLSDSNQRKFEQLIRLWGLAPSKGKNQMFKNLLLNIDNQLDNQTHPITNAINIRHQLIQIWALNYTDFKHSISSRLDCDHILQLFQQTQLHRSWLDRRQNYLTFEPFGLFASIGNQTKEHSGQIERSSEQSTIRLDQVFKHKQHEQCLLINLEAQKQEPTTKDLKMQITHLKSEIERLTRVSRSLDSKPIQTNANEFSVPISQSSPSRFFSSSDMSPNADTVQPSSSQLATTRSSPNKPTELTNSPAYYSTQLHDLRQTGELELIKAQLNLSERRRRYLEQRITELAEDLSRAKAETRSTETSLSAARRTEAALRRRLLVAMDLNRSQTAEGNLSRHSLGAPLNGVGEVRDVVELQANIAKLEATNASLVEAAQLDRTRIHEQAMRIEQLESDHRALIDRISSLQAAEAGAQRGIVRLQALYEDMLHEYAESKCQEFSWRSRERAQSRNRSPKDLKSNGSNGSNAKPTCQSNPLNEQATDSIHASVNGLPCKSLVGIPNSSSEAELPVPVGSCQQPNCASVRRLLDNVLTQLVDKQQETCLKHTSSGPISSDLSKSSPFMNELRNQLTFLTKLLNQSNLDEKQPRLRQHITHCLRLLTSLEQWIDDCLNRQDAEVTGLRSKLLDLQLQTDRLNSTLVTKSNPKNPKQSFTCSISLTKKPDLEAILSREHEILKLREQLQRLDAELRISKTKAECQSTS